MAEGGSNGSNNGKDDPEDPNPYSFQKFIKKQSKSNENDDEKPEQRRRNEPNNRPQKREENPFSFKQFLNKDVPNKPKVYSLMVDDISETCGGSRTRTLTPDLATDLPDFVQGHFITDANHHESKSYLSNKDLNANSRNTSDSSLFFESRNTSNSFSNPNFPDLTLDDGANSDVVNGIHNESAENPSFEVEAAESSNDNQDSVVLPLRLPDFLSDGPMLNHVPTSDDNLVCSAMASNKCPYCQADTSEKINKNELELNELRRVNSELINQLDSSRVLSESNSRKVLRLEKEVEVLKSKEVAETAALEEMVRQVERNLQTTTQRASKAENTVTKLKQDIKSLQHQVSALTSENESLKNQNPISSVPDEVRAKADNISTMLNCAATEAETSLKQLMRGIDHLRFLSTVAKNIDKVVDSTPSGDS